MSAIINDEVFLDSIDKPTVSAIILDYNKAGRVVENVQGLLRQDISSQIEIIVADNSCNADNAAILAPLAQIKNVRLFINSQNSGYTKGCNDAAKHAKGSYILIVNPDIVWPCADSVGKLVQYLIDHPKVGIVGPRQIDEPTGQVTLTIRAFPNLLVQILRRTILGKLPGLKRLVAYDEMRHLDNGKTQPVDWLQSSCLLIRRDLWDAVGGFDERYVIFMADPEISWQAWERGFQTVYYADVTVAADGIRCSTGGLKDFFRRPIVRRHMRDAIRYAVRHLGKTNPRLRCLP